MYICLGICISHSHIYMYGSGSQLRVYYHVSGILHSWDYLWIKIFRVTGNIHTRWGLFAVTFVLGKYCFVASTLRRDVMCVVCYIYLEIYIRIIYYAVNIDIRVEKCTFTFSVIFYLPLPSLR